MPIDTVSNDARTLLEKLVQDSVVVQTKFSKRGKVGRILGTMWTIDKSGSPAINIGDWLLENNFAKSFKELD
jgi:endonuclease YncB( thermonuclease family)